MSTPKQVFLLFFLVSTALHAFIPPLDSMIKDSMGRRRHNRQVEIIIRHRIAVSEAEMLNVEEHIATVKSGFVFAWKLMGQDGVAYGTHGRGHYVVNGSKLSTRSNALLQYLTASNPDALRNTLLSEHFIARDQLLQFKPTFTPSGDPQLWEVKDNYVRHDTIYLKRLGPNASAIVVEGSGSREKSIYFSQQLNGIERLEWADGEKKTTWDFDQFTTAYKTPGLFPKRFRFQQGGRELVSSEMVVHHPVSAKVPAAMRKLAATHRGTNTNLQKALQILLSYR